MGFNYHFVYSRFSIVGHVESYYVLSFYVYGVDKIYSTVSLTMELLYLTQSQLMKGLLHYKLYLYDLEALTIQALTTGYT